VAVTSSSCFPLLSAEGRSGTTVHDYLLKPVSPKEFDQLLENLSAELSRRDNRQGLYSRAVLADEVLKLIIFFQGLFTVRRRRRSVAGGDACRRC